MGLAVALFVLGLARGVSLAREQHRTGRDSEELVGLCPYEFETFWGQALQGV